MHVKACEHMQKHTLKHVKTHANTCKKYTNSRENAYKLCKMQMHIHAYKNTLTYLKITQIHEKKQTNAR